MTRCLLAAFCLLPMLAPAQNARKTLTSALETLRSSSTVFARMSGTESKHGQVQEILTDLWYRTRTDAGRQIAELELREFRNGQPSRRIVGDGVARWAYDFTRNEYSVSRYGTDQGDQPGRYVDRLLQRFDALLPNPEASLGRLMKDTFGGDVARLSDWLPAAEPQFLTAATPDPVNPNVLYVPTSELWYVHVYRPGIKNRSICFAIAVDPDTQVLSLRTVYGSEASSTARSGGSTWRIDVATAAIPDGANFQFVAPANARPIVAR